MCNIHNWLRGMDAPAFVSLVLTGDDERHSDSAVAAVVVGRLWVR